MERIVCLVLGYVFGLFQTGYIYSKMHNMDIREHGSGNAGSTNVLRVMGPKAGLIVFWGDCLKMVFACLIVRLLFKEQTGTLYVYLLYTGLGVILGHNYPFYMNFKGGKGIAASAGLLLATDWRITLICLVLFVIIVAATRYVSLGSIVIMAVFLVGMVLFGTDGSYGLAKESLVEFYMVAFAISGLGIWRHRANIGRLLKGTENKVGKKKG